MKEVDYRPQPVKIESVKELAPGVRLFRLDHKLDFNPGQFIELSVLGVGEIVVVITSHPSERFIEVAVRKVGTVTGALHSLQLGDTVGIRGPFGNGFSREALLGQNLILIAGGLGIVPLRPLVKEILKHRGDYGEVVLLYGCRSPQGLLFEDEVGQWGSSLHVHCTVDQECEDWHGHVGMVTSFFNEVELPSENVASVMCGPPVMFKFVVDELKKLGVPDEKIFMSLERHMKCGVGKCQHCTFDKYYVCLDGPVFSYAQVKDCDWQ